MISERLGEASAKEELSFKGRGASGEGHSGTKKSTSNG